MARTLAYLEAVVRQLYLAVLIAGLVGRHVANPEPASEPLPRPGVPHLESGS